MSDLTDALDAWDTRPPRDIGVDTEAMNRIVAAARRVADGVVFTTHWCEINGIPGYDCPDHERHHRREQEAPTGRCGERTLIAIDPPEET